MKRILLVSALVGAFAASSAVAQTPDAKAAKPAVRKASTDTQGAGHTAPKPQPGTEAAPSAPEGQLALGAVRL